jgi:hypothetical protein
MAGSCSSNRDKTSQGFVEGWVVGRIFGLCRWSSTDRVKIVIIIIFIIIIIIIIIKIIIIIIVSPKIMPLSHHLKLSPPVAHQGFRRL